MNKIPLSRDALSKEDIDSLIEWLSQEPVPKLSQGELVDRFEKAWSRKLGVKYSVFVNSGSSANLLLIYALKLKYGIEKIVLPSLSWSTTVSPALQLGLKPILCETDRDTLSINLECFEQICKEEKPDALFLVQVLGIPGKMREIEEICNKYKVLCVEDCCEAMESVYDGKKVGTFGLASTFSLYYAHILCGCEAGLVSTNDEELYNIVRSLASHGWSRFWESGVKEQFEEKYNINEFMSNYTFYYPGFNFRNTEMNAHLALTQLARLDEFCEKRKKLLQLYDRLIVNDYWKLKVCSTDVGFAYPIIHPKLDILVQKLYENNIEVRPLLAGNMGLQPFWVERFGEKHFEFSDIIHKYGCYVPIHHNITEEEVSFICQIVNEVLNG